MAMLTETGREFGRAVCKALGLETARTRKLVITIDAVEGVSVEVTRRPDADQLAEVAAVIQRFDVTAMPKSEDDDRGEQR